MKTLSVKLPDPLARWLLKQSRDLRRTQSDLVRQALEAERQKKNGPSCHDLMKDYCGSFSGPPDLSTNPKYMDGYGK